MATFNKDDKEWLKLAFKQGRFSEMDWTMMDLTFDSQTDFDVQVAEQRVKKETFMRRICLYKKVIYPFDYLATLLFLGSKRAQEKKKINNLYNSYYRKKISLEKLEKELKYIFEDGKII